MNDYDDYEDEYNANSNALVQTDEPLLLPTDVTAMHQQSNVDFEDPAVVALPRILLMGPRRGGKTSIQVCCRVVVVCQCVCVGTVLTIDVARRL
jgi:hypothetical protein